MKNELDHGVQVEGQEPRSSCIALLADVHGNLPALEAVVADLSARRVSRIVNLGDNASGPLWPRETVEFLARQPWIHISGNRTNAFGVGPRFAALGMTGKA